MARKKWSYNTEVTPSLEKVREKRKWQIALRRYVLEKNNCNFYAPYFGLDIEKMRKWFEVQFEKGISWSDFAVKWQFEHIVPVTYFDFTDQAELKLCWNFTNLKAEQLKSGKEQLQRLNLATARIYFEEIYNSTFYDPCRRMVEKINAIELQERFNSQKQQAFIKENKLYLDILKTYTAFEFELLNMGRNITEINKETEFFKKFAGQ